MKTYIHCIVVICLLVCAFSTIFAQTKDSTASYVIRQDTAIQKDGLGPHHGTGTMTESIFFDDVKGMIYSFRRTALHAGGSIGKHLQKTNEVYYFLSGTGTMRINDKEIIVKPGDAVLTLAGSTHECKQTGKDDLVIIVVYEKEKKN